MKKVGILFAIVCSLSLGMAQPLFADIISKPVTYQQDQQVCEGWLVYDNTSTAKRPGVLIFHQWMGITNFEKGQAIELVKLGYVAFVADIYGRNVHPKDMKEANALATKYRSDRALMRNRANAAFQTLSNQSLTDPNKIVAIGYCFGGGVALELARSGANLKGAVSFHGNLDTPNPSDAKQIKGKILVLHGADDPYVPFEQVLAFRKEMQDAKANWQLNTYGNAVHAFTMPSVGNDASTGAAYNRIADNNSWHALRTFFAEVF